MPDIDKVYEQCEALEAERKRLRAKLSASMDLRRLWPEAFDHGPCTSRLGGAPSIGYTFTITRGDLSSVTWDIGKVPADVLEAYLASVEGLNEPALRKELAKAGANLFRP